MLPEWWGVLVIQPSANNKGALFSSLAFHRIPLHHRICCLHFCRSSLRCFRGYFSSSCSHSDWKWDSSNSIHLFFAPVDAVGCLYSWYQHHLHSLSVNQHHSVRPSKGSFTSFTILCWLINSDSALSCYLKWIRCSSGILSKCFLLFPTRSHSEASLKCCWLLKVT